MRQSGEIFNTESTTYYMLMTRAQSGMPPPKMPPPRNWYQPSPLKPNPGYAHAQKMVIIRKSKSSSASTARNCIRTQDGRRKLGIYYAMPYRDRRGCLCSARRLQGHHWLSPKRVKERSKERHEACELTRILPVCSVEAFWETGTGVGLLVLTGGGTDGL